MTNPTTIARSLSDKDGNTLMLIACNVRLGPATREQDRVRQKLRKLGLAAYCGPPMRWQITSLGIEVRQARAAILAEQEGHDD